MFEYIRKRQVIRQVQGGAKQPESPVGVGRDRNRPLAGSEVVILEKNIWFLVVGIYKRICEKTPLRGCLLYTSDAADE